MAVVQNIRRADRAVVDRLAEHGVATIHEAQGRRGLLDPGITPVWPGEAQARKRYRAGELSLDVNNMRERLERMGLIYTEQDETG